MIKLALAQTPWLLFSVNKVFPFMFVCLPVRPEPHERFNYSSKIKASNYNASYIPKLYH